MKKLLLLILLIATNVSGATVPADPWAHPRIWLAGDLLDSLQARAARNTTDWAALKAWVDANDTETNPATWFPTHDGTDSLSRLGAEAYYAINFALAFQADTPRVRAYAQAAYNTIIAADSMKNQANVTKDSITCISEYDSGYNIRFWCPSAALVYDWCYDSLTVGQRGRLAALLTSIMRDWYVNHRSTYDGSRRPMNNFYHGNMWAILTSGYTLYYDIATYPVRFVSYGRDTLAVEMEKCLLNHQMIWAASLNWGSQWGRMKGGLGPDAWGGYADNGAEFLGCAFGVISSVEGSPIGTIFGFSYPQELLTTYMYGLIPHTNFDSNWNIYAFGENSKAGPMKDSELYAVETMLGLGVATNDTIQIGKWFLDTYKGELADYGTTNNRLWIHFLCVDPTITTIDPEVDDSALGDAWLSEGMRTVFYRNDWHAASSGDISFELRGGNGRENHMANSFNTFRLNAGDALVSTYTALKDTVDVDPGATGYIGSEWVNSGLYVSADGAHGTVAMRHYARNMYYGDVKPRHFKNSDTLLYFSSDASDIYNNADAATRYSHIAHKATEWIYVKSDSILLMMDRAITDEANYRRVEPIVAGDTLWAAKESNKQWQIWTETQPTAYKTTAWRVAGKSSVADLIFDCNYPITGVNSSACYRQRRKVATSPWKEWRQVDSLATPTTDCIMLHTLKIVAHDDPFTFLTPTNALGACAVAAFRSNRVDTLDYLVVFNADSAAQVFTGDSIIFGHTDEPRENTTVIVANLASSTAYYWHAIPESGLLAVTLAKADPGTYTEVTSDTAGIAVFDIGAPLAGEECPTVTVSGAASQGVGATYATLHFDTDFNVHGGFRYHPTGENAWVYRHDTDADSASHTITVSGLELDSLYVWECNTAVAGCDSAAYGDSTDLQTTACPTITKSGYATQQVSRTEAILHFHTDELANATFKIQRVLGGDGVVAYRHDADADSTQHTIYVRHLKPYTQYTWSTNVKYAGCDSTAFANPQTFTTKGKPHYYQKRP